MLSRLQERLREFDIVHFHIDHLHLPVMRGAGVPFLTTLHGRLDLPEIAPLFRAHPEAPFVSISDAQRRPLPFANWAGTVIMACPRTCCPPRRATEISAMPPGMRGKPKPGEPHSASPQARS